MGRLVAFGHWDNAFEHQAVTPVSLEKHSTKKPICISRPVLFAEF